MHGLAHDHFEYAGFWRRLFAFFIDSIILSLLSTVILASIFGTDQLVKMHQISEFSQTDWIIVGAEQAIPALWTILFWIIFMATPGKLLVNCQVVDADTLQKARPTQLTLRYFYYLISLLPLGLGFFWIGFNRRRQGWHDKLANTVVILQDDSLDPLESYL